MNTIPSFIAPIFGKGCCKTRVGEYRSLCLGFGEKIYHGNSRLVDDFYSEWELRTYRRSWRIIRNNRIICGCNDPVDSDDELHDAVRQIDFGRVISLSNEPSGIDVRVEFDSGIAVDFLSTFSDDDDSFVIFCPENRCATFDVINGWLVGESSKPWRGKPSDDSSPA